MIRITPQAPEGERDKRQRALNELLLAEVPQLGDADREAVLQALDAGVLWLRLVSPSVMASHLKETAKASEDAVKHLIKAAGALGTLWPLVSAELRARGVDPDRLRGDFTILGEALEAVGEEAQAEKRPARPRNPETHAVLMVGRILIEAGITRAAASRLIVELFQICLPQVCRDDPDKQAKAYEQSLRNAGL
jgi:hypothetical protein